MDLISDPLVSREGPGPSTDLTIPPGRDPVFALFPCLPDVWGDALEEESCPLQSSMLREDLEYIPPGIRSSHSLPEQLRSISTVPECLPANFLDNDPEPESAAVDWHDLRGGDDITKRSIVKPSRNVLLQHCPNAQPTQINEGGHLPLVQKPPPEGQERGPSSSPTFVLNMTRLRDMGMHICLTCGHSYKHRSGLSRHKSISHKETTYSCPHCDLAYTRPDSLKTHINKVHQQGKRPKENRRNVKRTK